MPNPTNLSDQPNLVNKSIKKVMIKGAKPLPKKGNIDELLAAVKNPSSAISRRGMMPLKSKMEMPAKEKMTNLVKSSRPTGIGGLIGGALKKIKRKMQSSDGTMYSK